jgi:predicted DNA-binding transcriptional regulator YafY
MKMNRLISIIMLLLERKTVSAAELARTFDVSTRTIYRDLDTIGQAGIPIVTQMGPGGGVSIMEQYKIDKRLFTASDITSLLIGLSGMRSAIAGDEVGGTLAKVRGLIPREQLAEIEAQSERIAIDLTPWEADARLGGYLALIKAAMAKHHILRIEYIDARGRRSSREAEPYRLLHKGDGWYMQGFCLLRGEFRTFRLSRIASALSTGTVFEPRPFDASVFSAQLSDSPALVEVIFRFREEAKPEVVGFYGEGAVEACGDGFYLARVMLLDEPYGYHSLLFMAEHCECLSPPYVREYIAERTREMAKVYQ